MFSAFFVNVVAVFGVIEACCGALRAPREVPYRGARGRGEGSKNRQKTFLSKRCIWVRNG